MKGGWTYRLKPFGWRGREKVRHFNDLKDVLRLNRSKDSSEDEEKVATPPPKPTSRPEVPEKKSAKNKDPIKRASPRLDLPQEEIRRSTRVKSNPKRLVISDMKAKRYDEVQETITEVSSDDEVESQSSHDSLFSAVSEEVESLGEDSPSDC